jgi:hypothetical protein
MLVELQANLGSPTQQLPQFALAHLERLAAEILAG